MPNSEELLSDYTQKVVKAAERLHQCACEFEEPGACSEYFEALETAMEKMNEFVDSKIRVTR